MLAAGKWVMGIVGGGILLGTMLGAAADPKMKQAPAPWWQLTGRAEAATASDVQWVEAGPEDLNVFGGYRPDLDYDAVIWALPIPEYDLAALAEAPSDAPAYELPTVTYGMTEADAAAAEAQAAAAEAQAAAEAEPAPAPAPEVRKSELALAGIY